MLATPAPPRDSQQTSTPSGQGRVAQPAIAVVPVAFSAELLRQRRGGRGDDPAGRRVGQRLQGRQGALHRFPPSTGVAAAGGPAAPEPFCLPQRRRQSTAAGGGRWDRAVRQHERHALALRATSNSAMVAKFLPCSTTGVRNTTRLGPAMALNPDSSSSCVTHGTVAP